MPVLQGWLFGILLSCVGGRGSRTDPRAPAGHSCGTSVQSTLPLSADGRLLGAPARFQDCPPFSADCYGALTLLHAHSIHATPSSASRQGDRALGTQAIPAKCPDLEAEPRMSGPLCLPRNHHLCQPTILDPQFPRRQPPSSDSWPCAPDSCGSFTCPCVLWEGQSFPTG